MVAKDEKKGQPSMKEDGCKKGKKKRLEKDKKWLKKCPKGLKIGVKEGSQVKGKLAAKFWQTGQPNKVKYGCKQKEKEGSEEWRKREQKSKEKQGENR